MNKTVVGALLLLVISLTGCSYDGLKAGQSQSTITTLTPSGQSQLTTTTPTPSDLNTDDGFMGYVVKKENDRILVVSPNVQDFSANGGEKYFYDASWYTNSPSNIEIGQKVKVQVSPGLKIEPYPGRDKAVHVIIIKPSQPDGAILSETEAIRRALSSETVKEANYSVPAVKEVRYDNSASQWIVYVAQTSEEKVLEIKVDDQTWNRNQ